MDAIYGKLTESRITLNIMRDSISELGADIQKTIVNAGAEAREQGTLMESSAVTDVFEGFKKDIEGTGPGDLPTIDTDEFVPDGPEIDTSSGSTTQEATADD